jgi:carboxymethylenebutenolidase
MYPGCGHGFHCDGRASYRHEAAKDAWGKTIAWFNKYLKG